MKVQLTSANGSATRIALQAFAEEARRACQPGNLVPLPDQGSVRTLGDNSQQMIVDEAILHPYNGQPPGTGGVIADCDVLLRGIERFQGADASTLRESARAHVSKMGKLQAGSILGGLALGAGLYFAGAGWVGAGASLALAATGAALAERQKGQAREFETQLNGWDQAIRTGNPSRMPIPEHGAVSFEYVFMVEKGHIGVSRQMRIPEALYQQPPSWSGTAPTAGPERTLAAPENVASLDMTTKPKRWGKFDTPLWPETDVKIPEAIAQPARMAEQLDAPAGTGVQESGGRVMVGGVAVRKKKN